MPNIEKTRINEITKLHGEIIEHLRSSLGKAIKIGQLLVEQKAMLRHGEFTPWVKSNLPFTDRSARNYMRLFRERDRLKTETVSDLKSAYRLLQAPKENLSSPKNSTPCETLTLFDEDTICMRVSKEIQGRCPDAILHPIKMDSLLDQYRGDPDLGCRDIFEIVAMRGCLTVADYKEYVPLKIAEIKAGRAGCYSMIEITHANEDGKILNIKDYREIKSRAKKHIAERDRLRKQIKKIINRK